MAQIKKILSYDFMHLALYVSPSSSNTLIAGTLDGDEGNGFQFGAEAFNK